MSDWTVRRRGTDSSGRGIYASDYMWSWWEGVLADPALRTFAHLIVITQGSWMTVAGGGAKDSAGYHDGGGCFDLRVWNLTDEQVGILIRVLRRHGAAAWLRNLQHGGFSDAHIHLVLGTDHDLDDGAAYQWRDYIDNGDGMGGRDYHWRPSPLITTPPEADEMAKYEDELAAIKADTAAVLRIVKAERERGQRQTARVMDRLAVLVEKGKATKAELQELRDELAAFAAEDGESK